MSAVVAAVAVAQKRGLAVEEPVVLREAWHVLVAIDARLRWLSQRSR